MAVSKKPTKAKGKTPLKTVKPKAIKPAAKKAVPAKKQPAAKKKQPVVKKSLPAKKPPAAKTPASAPKKTMAEAEPGPTVPAVTASSAETAVTPPMNDVPSLAAAKPKAEAGSKTLLPPRPEPPEIIPPVPEVGADYMNAEQREFYRSLLLKQRAELTAEIEHTIHHMQDENINLPDPNDRASQEAEMTLELRSRDRETKLIHKIDEAIARIESGEYGYCENCGEPIGRRRLEARPTATLCIDCKRLEEIREKQVA